MGRREQGSASIEAAVVVPVVLLVLFMTIHAALWFYSRDVAMHAAQQGVDAARLDGASLGAGEIAARQYLSQVGGLTTYHIGISGGRQIRVTVTGAMPTIVPGLVVHISQSASGPREVFTGKQNG
ncbi:TadE/TadG family type IV pilus assembly protein [Mangrovactinospora gilvigrisea]|uniref:TadE/TadG family type IV pilus assembly protein n=1 Tax=Mangrovactinospora gilvigrisea TaxID=1428644 RepID=UPI001587ABED|nr:TadE/TadG family type IV pilus assembly protein [Mangrovactinospora gilvigrisea]